MTEIDNNRIPQHVAIIMDGNGRWATAQGKPRSAGHLKGGEVVRQITESAVRLGIKYLTLYAFSTENWNRPAAEVELLMELFFNELEAERELFINNNVRFAVIGDTSRLPEKVRQRMDATVAMFSHHTGMTLVIAISYSSRWELADAARRIAAEVAEGRLRAEDIGEQCISQHLSTSFMPDPDLLIRTGGELRISNYLLWQCAYAEFYFTPVLWPDFNEEELRRAVADYQRRQRRYGKTGEQVEGEEAKA